MDYPEVWNFKQKHKTLRLEKFPLSESVTSKIALKTVAASMVSILLPEVETNRLETIITDSDYYQCDDFTISDVLTLSFVEGFLKTGCLFCFAPSACSELEDCYSIFNNKLYIRLHNGSMHSVHAIELSKLNPRADGEFLNFTIDLLETTLDLSKLKEELKGLFEKSIRIFSWSPNSKDICSSSIAKYFSDVGRCVKLGRNKLKVKVEYGLKFPLIPHDNDEQSFAEISECIAMAFLGCNMEKTDFSSYQLPKEFINVGRGKVIHAKGCIKATTIQVLIDEALIILKENPSFPCIAISLISFSKPSESKLLVASKDSILQFS